MNLLDFLPQFLKLQLAFILGFLFFFFVTGRALDLHTKVAVDGVLLELRQVQSLLYHLLDIFLIVDEVLLLFLISAAFFLVVFVLILIGTFALLTTFGCRTILLGIGFAPNCSGTFLHKVLPVFLKLNKSILIEIVRVGRVIVLILLFVLRCSFGMTALLTSFYGIHVTIFVFSVLLLGQFLVILLHLKFPAFATGHDHTLVVTC